MRSFLDKSSFVSLCRIHLRKQIEQLFLTPTQKIGDWLFHNTDSLIIKHSANTEFQGSSTYGKFKHQLDCKEYLAYCAYNAHQKSLLYTTKDDTQAEITHCSGFKATFQEKISHETFEALLIEASRGLKRSVKYRQSRKVRRTQRLYTCTFTMNPSITKTRHQLKNKLFTVAIGTTLKVKQLIEAEITNRDVLYS